MKKKYILFYRRITFLVYGKMYLSFRFHIFRTINEGVIIYRVEEGVVGGELFLVPIRINGGVLFWC